ncbi:essential MCU regulator, mitochondrial [Leptopilina boulardi]|uniref:essential MCU regulator, mitochondrial n=1 Tax=Leptopilina boulardi TaxID=63433 RepID=UPI0021F5A1CE|nr:essential MCU regulator, mitochondrial [Leptopilina boulardi]
MTTLLFKFVKNTSVLHKVNRQPNLVKICRTTTSPSGAILPEPKRPRFGFVGIVCGIAFGLFVGAAISKNIANFLEENDLFVPSDDDDDDD